MSADRSAEGDHAAPGAAPTAPRGWCRTPAPGGLRVFGGLLWVAGWLAARWSLWLGIGAVAALVAPGRDAESRWSRHGSARRRRSSGWSGHVDELGRARRGFTGAGTRWRLAVTSRFKAVEGATGCQPRPRRRGRGAGAAGLRGLVRVLGIRRVERDPAGAVRQSDDPGFGWRAGNKVVTSDGVPIRHHPGGKRGRFDRADDDRRARLEVQRKSDPQVRPVLPPALQPRARGPARRGRSGGATTTWACASSSTSAQSCPTGSSARIPVDRGHGELDGRRVDSGGRRERQADPRADPRLDAARQRQRRRKLPGYCPTWPW